MKFKKAVLAGALALAFGASGTAQAGAIKFDLDGSGGGANVIMTDTMDWGPSNVLLQDIFPATGFPVTSAMTVRAQGSLAGFLLGGGSTGPLAGSEFTFQMVAPMAASASVGGKSILYEYETIAAGGTFMVWYDPTKDSNATSGLGYGGGGDAILIMTGSVNIGSAGNTTVTTAAPTKAGFDFIDGYAGGAKNDSQVGVKTHPLSGSLSFNIDVTSADSGFFITDVTADPFSLDLTFGDGTKAPFDATDPSASVVGATPTYGGTIAAPLNGEPTCDPADATCDIHAQSDPASPFSAQAVPEPASLALLGMGLGVLGFGAGWKRRKKV